MELYSVNHHLISYSEIFTSLSHWSSNLEFCSTTFYCKLLQVLVPWKSHVPLLFFKLAYREVGMIFSSGPGQAYLCSWKAHSQSLDCTFLAGGWGLRDGELELIIFLNLTIIKIERLDLFSILSNGINLKLKDFRI